MFLSSTPFAYGLMFVVGFVIPALSALFTPAHVPAWVIGLVTPLLSILSGFLTEAAVSPGSYDWGHGATLALASGVSAVIGYAMTWRGALTERLHKVWPHASTSSIDAMINAGVGVITPLIESHAPLVTGNAAPEQQNIPAPNTDTAPTPEPAAAPVVESPAPVAPKPAPAPAPAPVSTPAEPAATPTVAATPATPPSLPEIAAQLTALQAQVTAALAQPATH